MKKNKIYLKHIYDSICDIESFLKGLTLKEFLKNKEKQYAVVRALEIIGEATKNITLELKKKHQDIPWRKVAGIRDKLIHEYFGIKFELIWETVTKDIPEFKKEILEILNDMQ